MIKIDKYRSLSHTDVHISNTDQFITLEQNALFPDHGLSLKRPLQSIKGCPKEPKLHNGSWQCPRELCAPSHGPGVELMHKRPQLRISGYWRCLGTNTPLKNPKSFGSALWELVWSHLPTLFAAQQHSKAPPAESQETQPGQEPRVSFN